MVTLNYLEGLIPFEGVPHLKEGDTIDLIVDTASDPRVAWFNAEKLKDVTQCDIENHNHRLALMQRAATDVASHWVTRKAVELRKEAVAPYTRIVKASKEFSKLPRSPFQDLLTPTAGSVYARYIRGCSGGIVDGAVGSDGKPEWSNGAASSYRLECSHPFEWQGLKDCDGRYVLNPHGFATPHSAKEDAELVWEAQVADECERFLETVKAAVTPDVITRVEVREIVKEVPVSQDRVVYDTARADELQRELEAALETVKALKGEVQSWEDWNRELETPAESELAELKDIFG